MTFVAFGNGVAYHKRVSHPQTDHSAKVAWIARDIGYRVQVCADASQTTIDDLIRTTDSVTEIQNTLRSGCAVRLISS